MDERIGSQELGNFQFGLHGVVNATTGTTTKNIVAVQALEESVVTITENKSTGDLEDLTMTAGMVIYGSITAVEVTSGLVRMYLGSNQS